MRTDVPREATRQGMGSGPELVRWPAEAGIVPANHADELPWSSPSVSKRKAFSPPLPCQIAGSVLRATMWHVSTGSAFRQCFCCTLRTW